ncbi:Outer membrane protein assembly factor BamD [Candidatus Erwinia haradaeae]|uniref:Outer membrane protein assembly factor BamD n=1 Tax=Candidatus Erwinia haradaeae TaxID=1922217 RepID=A0A451DD01_9GAMM|nr:outer membrane protein assembly factor BamD [Candidatus Erwinia haradaeae]VFP84282.1 Outer membrane protein assembly factor BamD [Candidatus Erwinia haradaeae]
MTNIKYLLTAVSLSVWLCGCSQSINTSPDQFPIKIFASAEKKIKDGRWKEAITQLESIYARYPFSPYSQQIQVDLVYAYYKNSNLSLALEAIDRFMRLYPNYANMDYIIYIRGLTYMAQDHNPIHTLFHINRSDRDPFYRLSAFDSFSQLIRNYPNSRYAKSSRDHLIYLKERQAQYDLSVAEFYAQRQAYVAVVNRVAKMLTDYPDTKATKKALPLMENAYRQLHLDMEAKQVTSIIAANTE